jgi:hypothetical protein
MPVKQKGDELSLFTRADANFTVKLDANAAAADRLSVAIQGAGCGCDQPPRMHRGRMQPDFHHGLVE